ncbi:hypothetical protein H480_15721 [Amycolatopsis vancoresmycina DSM 44592]|uniref:Uncharacterized protein n=1 Tax=Amycolatopsis vancoresmycina DSM 44592 TaxID=1292037 RepID=R1G874_9PSEU|nr:hypothetical protein H480_15721 [Amycolatopsis vancoresmycina DSM 44592]
MLLCAVLAVLGLVAGPASAVDPPPNSEPYTAPIDQPLPLGQCYRDIKHGYYAKNVYGACWFSDMQFVHYACPEPECAVDGSAAAYVYTTLNVLKESRQVAVAHRFVNWRISGVPDSARLGVTISCGPAAGGGGVCDRPSVPVVKSIAEWKVAPDVTEVFSLDGVDAPAAGVSPEVAAELRTEYRVTARFAAEVPAGERYTLTEATAGTGVRCDVARQADPAYVRGADCVLRTWYRPWFDFSAGEAAIAEPGAFVRAVAPAGYLPGFPGVNGTSAGFTGPQYRLFYDVAARQAHRAAAEAKCLSSWGPDWWRHAGGLTNACAAYPFDESVQGAAPGVQFQVRPVLDTQQAEFLRRFTRFLAENHVLDGDGYYVYPLP